MRRLNHLAKLLLLIALTSAVAALGQSSGGPYTIDPASVDNGGGTSSAGPYRVQGTLGQPEAGVSIAGRYALTGGIWVQIGDVIFHNGFE